MFVNDTIYYMVIVSYKYSVYMYKKEKEPWAMPIIVGGKIKHYRTENKMGK